MLFKATLTAMILVLLAGFYSLFVISDGLSGSKLRSALIKQDLLVTADNAASVR